MNVPVTVDAGWLLLTALLALRLSVILALLPLLSGRSVPVLWRLAVAVALAAAAAPAAAAALPPGPLVLSWPLVAGEGLRSLLVGALLAFVVGIPLAAVRFAGAVIGIQVGFSMVNTIDPAGAGRISVLGNLYYLLGVLLLFALDAHHAVVRVLVASCRLVPPLAPWQPAGGAWWVLRDFGRFFGLGLQVAAPVIAASLLVSVAMGFIVKTVPQFNILVAGFPVKIAVGLLALGLSLTYYGQVMGHLLAQMGDDLGRLLAALQA